MEIGLHNPLAAAVGRKGESEWALAQRLLAQLPKRALLLGDRLYGVVAFARVAQAACRTRRQSVLAAGLAVGEAPRDQAPPPMAVDWSAFPYGPRAIRTASSSGSRSARFACGWRRDGHRAHELRLWTTLLDPRTAPALELARVYARRWEHELYFREIKRQLRRTALLQSHTVETGAQEIAAIVLASAVIASERARAATGQIPALRVSFGQVLNIVRGMWLFLGPFDDVFTDQQKTRVVRRGRTLIRRSLIRAPTATHVSARRAPARDPMAATPEARIDRTTVGASTRMTRRRRISERHCD